MITIGYIISAFIFAISLFNIVDCIDRKKHVNIIDILVIAMEICFIISWRYGV